MKEFFTEENYYLHLFSYLGSLRALGEEIKRIEASPKKSLWYYSGKATLKKLKKGRVLMEKGRKGGLPLTPHDVRNIIYVLLKELKK